MFGHVEIQRACPAAATIGPSSPPILDAARSTDTGLREALEAVDELDRLLGHLPDCPCPGHAAIKRLRAALEETDR